MKFGVLAIISLLSLCVYADSFPPPVVSCGTESTYFLLRQLGHKMTLKQICDLLERPEGSQLALASIDAYIQGLGCYTLAVKGPEHRYGKEMSVGAIGHLIGEKYPLGHYCAILPAGENVLLFVPPGISRTVSMDDLIASPSNPEQTALLLFDDWFEYQAFKLALQFFPNQILLRVAAYFLTGVLIVSLAFGRKKYWRRVHCALLIALTTITVFSIWTTPSAGGSVPDIVLSVEPERITLEPGRAAEKTSFSFAVRNHSNTQIDIAALKSSCPCIQSLEPDSLTAMPKGTIRVTGDYTFSNGGSKRSKIYIVPENQDVPPVSLEILSYVMPSFRYDRRQLVCTDIGRSDLPLHRTIRLYSFAAVRDSSLRPLSIETSEEWILASISEPSLLVINGAQAKLWNIGVALTSALDRGEHRGNVVLKTNAPERMYKEITFSVIAEFQ